MIDVCEFTRESIKRSGLPRSQAAYCLLAARAAIAKHGPMPERLIRSAAIGLARGLYGPAYKKASARQRRTWIDLAEREYRKALGAVPSKVQPGDDT